MAVRHPASRKRSSPSPQILRAVLHLRELILTGELAAGQRVAELKLVKTAGVSRTPLRLAMERLEHEGLLARRPSGGFTVREFSFRDVQNSIELRGALEGLACRFAAEGQLDEAALADIHDTLARIDETLARSPGVATFERYVALNERFHDQLFDLATSPLLGRLLGQVRGLPFASPSAFVQIQATLPESGRILVVAQEQHRTIVEAIIRRDATRAEVLAREHARLAQRNLDIAARDRESFRRMPGGPLIRFG